MHQDRPPSAGCRSGAPSPDPQTGTHGCGTGIQFLHFFPKLLFLFWMLNWSCPQNTANVWTDMFPSPTTSHQSPQPAAGWRVMYVTVHTDGTLFSPRVPHESTQSPRASLLHSPASGRHNRPKRTLNVLPKGSAVLIWQLWRSFASSEQASGWTDSCTDNYHQGWTTENSSFASYKHIAPSRPQVNAGSNPTLSPGTACRILVPGPDGRTLTTTLHG